MGGKLEKRETGRCKEIVESLTGLSRLHLHLAKW